MLPVLLVLALTAALLILLMKRGGDMMVDNLHAHLSERLADTAEVRLATHLDAAENLTRLNSFSYEAGYLDFQDTNELLRMLASRLQVFPMVLSTYFADAEGNFYCVSRRGPSGELSYGVARAADNVLNVRLADQPWPEGELLSSTPGFIPANRPWYRAAVEADDLAHAWTSLYPMFDFETATISSSISVQDAAGQLAGVFASDLAVAPHLNSFLFDFFSIDALALPEEARIFLLDEKQHVIAASDPTAFVPMSEEQPQNRALTLPAAISMQPSARLANELLNAAGPATRAEPLHASYLREGQPQLLTLHPLQLKPEIRWHIGVALPRNHFAAGVSQTINQALLLGFIVLLLAAFLGHMLLRKLLLPVEELRSAAENLAAGEWDQPLPIHRRDELGDLARSFQKMSFQLKSSFSSLQTRFQDLAENVPGMIYQYYLRRDGTCGFYYVSPRAKDIFGFEPEQLISGSLLEFLHQNDRQRYLDSIEESRQNMSDWVFEGRYIRPDGEERWWRGLSKPMRGQHGEVLWNGIAIDITESRRQQVIIQRTQQSLQESEHLHRTLVEMAQDAIIMLQDGECIFANPATSELLGRPVEQVMGSRIWDSIPPDERRRLRGMYDRRIAGEEIPNIYESAMLHRSGHRIPIEVSAVRVTLNGRFADQVIMRDITQRKKAEEEIRETNAWFHTLVEQSTDGISIFDKSGRQLFASPANQRILGYPPEDLHASGLQDLIHPDDLPHALEHLERLRSRPNGMDGTILRIRHKDGSYRTLEVLARNALDTSKINGIIVNFHDITARIETERQLRQAKDAAEAASEAKSEFLANMSHEIRTPMNAILGFSKLLEMEITDKTQRQQLTSIIKSGNSLLSLINDLLDLSKIEARKLQLEFEPVNLATLCRDVYNIFENRAQQKGIQLILEFDDHLPDSVLLDEIRLRQILLNLVGNAVKFTHKGSVTLQVERLYVDLKPDDVSIQFSIIDTGIGIRPEDSERIFLAFEQQSNQKTREYGGTGLGLTITKRLVEMMKGTIHVQSAPGKGSTFLVRLPAQTIAAVKAATPDTTPDTIDATPENAPPTPAEDLPLQDCRILLIEDSELNRTVIQNALQEAGAAVTEAGNGQEGLHLATKNPPDLIILDLNMPIVDGRTLARRLRSQKSTAQIPILILTASPPRDSAALLSSLHLQGMLLKPVSRTELLESVIAVIPHPVEQPDDPDSAPDSAQENGNPPDTAASAGPKPPQPSANSKDPDDAGGEPSPRPRTPAFRRTISRQLNHSRFRIAPGQISVPRTPQVRAQFERLTDTITQRLDPQFQGLRKRRRIGQLTQFAQDLRLLAEEYPIQPLRQFSQEIDEALENLDIVQIEQLLQRYPELVQDLRQLSQDLFHSDKTAPPKPPQ